MRKQPMLRRSTAAIPLALPLVLLMAACPKLLFAQSNGIDAQAVEILRSATAFLAGQQQFSVDTRSTIEVVLESGQKLQFDHTAALLVQRPNKLRAERLGDLVDQVFYYDGEQLTLHNPGNQVYATVAAPGTLEEMMDFARDSLDIVAPAGDLIYTNAFEILMQDVSFGFVVGNGVVEGVRCEHLAFRKPHVDWQIWIQQGAEPLPCKLVITSRDVPGAPQFAVVMTQWDLDPEIAQGAFDFTPPADAIAAEFVSAGVGTPESR